MKLSRQNILFRLGLLLALGLGFSQDVQAKKRRAGGARVVDANDILLGRLAAANPDALAILTPRGYMVTLDFQGGLIYYRAATEIHFVKAGCMGAPYFPLYGQPLPYHKILIRSFRSDEIFEPYLDEGTIKLENVTYLSTMHDGKCVNYFVDDKEGKHTESTSKVGFRLRRVTREKAGLPEEIKGPLRIN